MSEAAIELITFAVERPVAFLAIGYGLELAALAIFLALHNLLKPKS